MPACHIISNIINIVRYLVFVNIIGERGFSSKDKMNTSKSKNMIILMEPSREKIQEIDSVVMII